MFDEPDPYLYVDLQGGTEYVRATLRKEWLEHDDHKGADLVITTTDPLARAAAAQAGLPPETVEFQARYLGSAYVWQHLEGSFVTLGPHPLPLRLLIESVVNAVIIDDTRVRRRQAEREAVGR